MKYPGNLYQFINILSLDVVAGAVVSALFFAALFHVNVPTTSLVSLALTVWVIYTTDHLRDAMAIPGVANTDRHRFHQQYFRTILFALIVALVADTVIVFLLPRSVLHAGVLLGFIVAVYLVLQRYLKFLKEFFVACLYSLGVMLPALVMQRWELDGIYLLIAVKFFITAWMNLLIFSLYDYEDDRHHRQHSFVTRFGPVATRNWILLLGLLNIVSGIALWSFDVRVAVIFVSMNLILLGVLLFRTKLAAHNLYRLLGDAVFFIPGINLL